MCDIARCGLVSVRRRRYVARHANSEVMSERSDDDDTNN
jgi:hypothetical protein